ncbi:hypothetical protein [Ramlibacter rhizophilus]|uniref:hypothetical protein n=1 Tax=Ramlibacter rhizophilus TaxID=1781167 RepID=UPI0014323FE4|nr:hypothetical protein [Ramlibacter rhizophilus]
MNALDLLRLVAAGAVLALAGGCGDGGGEVITGPQTPAATVKGVPIPARVDLVELR